MNLHGYMESLKNEITESIIRKFEIWGNRADEDVEVLKDSILYSIKNGGKKFRPILLLMTLEAFGVDRSKGMATAMALEMIHTYSLIHDDLPAMDNDDLRRGIPTNHKVYGEALAILAGDSLLTESFSLISADESISAETRLELILFLSKSAGTCGMIAGQVMDMEAENETIQLEKLKKIHELKTGRLIEFACLAAGLIAKQNNEIMADLSEFAQCLGLAFQIQDDILDVEGDTEIIGKPVGSDEANGKSTYASLLGLDGAKNMLANESDKALELLNKLPADTNMLRELTLYVVSRNK